MLTLSRSSLSPSRLQGLQSKSLFPFFSSLTHSQFLTHARNLNPQLDADPENPIFFNYLIDTFGFSKPRALSISNRYSWIKTTEKPQSVVQLFKSLGFSDTHIRSSARVSPQILFSDIHKTLTPKLQFFQELGLTGSDLGKFISKNSTLLTRSLDKKLKPSIKIVKEILTNTNVNQNLIRVLERCNWIAARDLESIFLTNVSYLKSCGIVGSQLSMLLVRQPRLFMINESKLRDLVSRVSDMGFSINSRMFVYAIYTVSCISSETLKRKIELFQSFDFSEAEFMEMFKRAPELPKTSEVKLKLGIEFFMNTIKLKKIVLVYRPTILMFSMKERVLPRYRVLQIMKSKRLFKKEPSFLNVLSLTEEEFLDKFISRFRDDAEELLVAYKGN